MIIKAPVKNDNIIRELRIGDVFYVSGTIYTMRDQAHRRILELHTKPPIDLKGAVIYHCGPIVKRINEKWTVVSAGPTTSSRMDKYIPDLIREFGIKIIIGKGELSEKVVTACRKYCAIYGIFPGGMGALAARSIQEVLGVEWMDLGMPEAIWKLKVEKFGPVFVAIDAHGDSLLKNVKDIVRKNVDRLLSSICSD
ncbi:hypothetical protein DRN86_03355 [Candidatus Geothermarchaeota archaeon]|nr:MAG: hypothetical protein DRN86_03355 [Candidatus Geothermarchaeota archaeon]